MCWSITVPPQGTISAQIVAFLLDGRGWAGSHERPPVRDDDLTWAPEPVTSCSRSTPTGQRGAKPTAGYMIDQAQHRAQAGSMLQA